MNTILLFGAGKSSTSLISYLVEQAPGHDWQVIVADADRAQAQSKIGANAGQRAKAIAIQVEDGQAREDLISQADIVISLLPPSLHFLVASSCIVCQKSLLTASYLDDKIKSLEPAVRENGLLFLC